MERCVARVGKAIGGTARKCKRPPWAADRHLGAVNAPWAQGMRVRQERPGRLFPEGLFFGRGHGELFAVDDPAFGLQFHHQRLHVGGGHPFGQRH